MKESGYTLWCAKEGKSFYLVPSHIQLWAGPIVLEDMSGNTASADAMQLNIYACTEQQAQQHLEQEWKDSVEQSKKAWSQLYRLSELCGRNYDLNKLKKGMLDGLSQEGTDITQAFEHGKTAVEELLKAVEAGDPGTPEDEKNIFKKIFSNIDGFGDLFSDEELDKAATDPDAWAEKLQEQFITPAEKAKMKERQDKLAAEISESIAEGLRKAGIKPAGDFKKK